jgi:uncharacterized protein
MNQALEFAQSLLKGFQEGHTISGALKERKLANNPYYDLACAEVNRFLPTCLDQEFFEDIRSYVDETMAKHKYRFVAEHGLRVRNLAVQIMPTGVDAQMIETACLLHDIGKPFGEDHASCGAKIAQQWLIEHNIQGHEKIAQWIQEHGAVPTTLESKVLHDADKLDKIGISGVCILLAKAYLKDMGLDQLLKLYRTEGDVPRFFGKHKIGSDTFHTPVAKKLAPGRVEVRDTFFRELGP